jgi:ubiquinone/menaquinone biosynthesis C-methylase UbiE/ribosomal protein S18 acetylase RimI-like enzyme
MKPDRFAEYTERILAENERRRREIPADFYSPMRLPNVFINTQRNRRLMQLLRREHVTSFVGQRILDVGCGTGEWLLDLLSWGASPESLSGVDIDPRQIGEAEPKLPRVDLRVGNAAALPWPDDHFDIVIQATLFTSILDADFRRAIADEMARVTKPGGLILWYDSRYSNPWNPTFRGIRSGEIRRLFPSCSFRFRSVTLLPPLARKIVPASWMVASLLEKLPFLRTHILGIIKLPHKAPPPRHLGAPTRLQGVSGEGGVHYFPMTRSQADEVAELHALCFREFFLTGLGRAILSLYYSHYNGRPDTIAFVARSFSGRVIGFVAGSRNYEEFLHTFYRANFLPLALAIAKALFSNAEIREKFRQRTTHIKAAFRSLVRNRHSTGQAQTADGLSTSERAGLASVAVHPDFRGKGVAVRLFQLFEERAGRLGVRRIELSVLASSARAIAFYKKVGWQVARHDRDYVVFEKML